MATDILTGEVTCVTDVKGGIFGEGVLRFYENGTLLSHNLRREIRTHSNDPLSAFFKLHLEYEMGLAGWLSASALYTDMTCDAETFYLKARMRVTLSGEDVMDSPHAVNDAQPFGMRWFRFFGGPQRFDESFPNEKRRFPERSPRRM
ncbi:hypothetical protein [Aliiruegeria lutimaris]|uniref:hypothetical protein n=1 Tax=Aliiruegeria lutimaris TaxID=571298 RepID=UPI00111384AB|nr:hypothetical protein [Aliiruegeria lutimaris]